MNSYKTLDELIEMLEDIRDELPHLRDEVVQVENDRGDCAGLLTGVDIGDGDSVWLLFEEVDDEDSGTDAGGAA